MCSSTRAATSTSRTRTRASGSCGTRRNDAGRAGALVFHSGGGRWVAFSIDDPPLFLRPSFEEKLRFLRRRVAVDVLVDPAFVRTAIAAPALGRIAELVRRRHDDTALVDVGGAAVFVLRRLAAV